MTISLLPVLSALIALLFLPPNRAFAADGVLEINQTCAVQTGCFSGDGPGFPVTVDGSAGRSYRLTSDLDLTGEGASTGAIDLDGDSLALDLNGFEIRGPVVCQGVGSALTCDANLGADGIDGGVRTEVRNGRVIGFADDGIDLASGRVIDVVAQGNGGDGIEAGQVGFSQSHGSLVSGCMTSANKGHGIRVTFGQVRDSYSYGNLVAGIFLSGGGSIIGNTARSNGSHGISLGFPTSPSVDQEIVSDNAIISNTGNGITAANGIRIHNNVITGNDGHGVEVGKGNVIQGNSIFGNGGNGITASSSNLVAGNAVRENAGFGLFFTGSQSSYYGNVISVNTGGTVGFGQGNTAINSGQNTCNSSTSCP